MGVALLGALLFGASPAVAHNVVEDRTPAPGSTVTESPVDISLTTNEIFLDLGGDASGFGVVIRDSAGLYYGDGCVSVIERTMSASAELGAAGTYEITYQFVSADGHSLSESYEFDFAPNASHTPALGYDTPAQCGVPRDTPAAEADTSVTSTPIASEDIVTEEAPRDPILIVGFLSIVSFAVVVWIIWRVRQKHNGD
jgi:methionine-rich copper-binding protein CopC